MALEALDGGQISLAEAAALTEFEHDGPEVVDRLVRAAGTPQFDQCSPASNFGLAAYSAPPHDPVAASRCRRRHLGLGVVSSVWTRAGITSAVMRLSSVQEIYGHLAKTYDRELRDIMGYTAYLDIPRQIIDALGGPHARILDLGCGTGLSSLLFFEAGHDVTGIDGVGAMVRRARKLPYKKVIQQDLESRWRVKDDSFDAAVMLGVMEYIIYPHMLLRQVHDKLVAGGLFGFTVPHKSELYEKDGLKSYYAKEIRPVIVKSGFEILNSEKTLGYVDDGEKVVYWNYLVRKRTHA
ncbi:MAG TPA: class I SAM-dependent methyltransferase [Mycobacterium sp.]|nr:class I SAM-dependent methyltransferase [Mycobacterium sp.]